MTWVSPVFFGCRGKKAKREVRRQAIELNVEVKCQYWLTSMISKHTLAYSDLVNRTFLPRMDIT